MTSPSKKKILVVDDEEDWRVKTSESLTNAGFEVVLAADASEALRRAEQQDVGLIILDDYLGGESGIMLTRFLHRNHPEKPILLYTRVEYDDVTIRHVVEQGADQCLPKDSSNELLVTVGGYMTSGS
jgi:DNA-binding response OmpR family regulator